MKAKAFFQSLYCSAMTGRFNRAAVLLLVLMMAFAGPVLATPNLGAISDSMSTQGTSVAKFAVIAFAILGIILGGAGLHKITQARKTQEGMGMGIGMVIVGALLVALPLTINIMSNTTTGQDASGLNTLNLDN